MRRHNRITILLCISIGVIMGIANLTPHLSRVPGLSFVLAPVQALLALFVTSQSGPASSPRGGCPPAQVRKTGHFRDLSHSRSQGGGRVIAKSPLTSKHSRPKRLKVLREFEPGVNPKYAGRMVISGRMADVCAELDRMT
jgi:hypothetical protein